MLDPFVGAGTTATAAMLLGRRFIGIEAYKEYADVARKNIKDIEKLLSTK